MMVQREYMNNALGRIATFDKLMVDKMKKMKDNQDEGGGNIGYAWRVEKSVENTISKSN